MPTSRLTNDLKHIIVRELACYSTPSDVASLLHRNYGVTVSRQAVECYNPERCAGSALSEKWGAVFRETRRNFLKEAGQIGISHKAFRLQAMDEALRSAKSVANYPLVLRILALAAKEAP